MKTIMAKKESRVRRIEGYDEVLSVWPHKKITFEQRPEEGEGGSLVDFWEKHIPGGEKSLCKGPVVAGGRLACLKKSKEIYVSGDEV